MKSSIIILSIVMMFLDVAGFNVYFKSLWIGILLGASTAKASDLAEIGE